MTNSIHQFQFESNIIRSIIDENGNPLFVAADLCKLLGLGDHKGSYSHHLEKLDNDEKRLIPRSLLEGDPILNMGVVGKAFCEKFGANAQWAEPEIWMVTESGAYTLILRCRDAMKSGTMPYRVRKWLTTDVIPSIRKTGAYIGPNAETNQLFESVFNFSPSNNPFDQLDTELLRNLRLIAPPFAVAYMITKGVTPDFIDSVNTHKNKFLPAPKEIPVSERIPLDILVHQFIDEWLSGELGAPVMRCLTSHVRVLFMRYCQSKQISYYCIYDDDIRCAITMEIFNHPKLEEIKLSLVLGNDANPSIYSIVTFTDLKEDLNENLDIDEEDEPNYWIKKTIAEMEEYLFPNK